MRVARDGVKTMHIYGERVEADDRYTGEDPAAAKVPASMVHDQDDAILYERAKGRSRHEMVNKRLQRFRILASVFRHSALLHG